MRRDRGRDKEGRRKLGSHLPERRPPRTLLAALPPLSSPSPPPPPSPLSHLRLVLLQQPARARPPRVIGHVQDHHTPFLPADERAVRQALHHGEEILVAMVTRRHHRKGGPVVLLQHLEYDLQLEGGGGAELEKDGTGFLIWG